MKEIVNTEKDVINSRKINHKKFSAFYIVKYILCVICAINICLL